ncbi:MAG: VWA domain-containing protein [Desulfobacterales bacterium]|nr:VWA domain-containing protein [Desulfobacterales bacterium]
MMIQSHNMELLGLYTISGKQIPLRSLDIETVVIDSASKVVVLQKYINNENVPIEAVYSFPLEESSSICGFEVELDGRKIIGKVEEKKEAFYRYDKAISEGHKAFLMDQDRPNIFTVNVGNLMPGKEAVIKITYAADLDQFEDKLRLMIPTTISPRYIPREQSEIIDPGELIHISPETVLEDLPYGLKLKVKIKTSSKILAIECPSHPIKVSQSEKEAIVTLMGDSVQLDQDFVLTIQIEHHNEPKAVVAIDEYSKQYIVMINFFPNFANLKQNPNDIIFILDRSGSMGGESIEQAKKALLLCLRSLMPGDIFNIVGFGSNYEVWSSSSVPYNQENLDKATAYVKTIDADLGGTEILSPIKKVLESKINLPRQILLLTDGEVSNEKEVINYASKFKGKARIFVFGIGRGPSEFFVRGLSRATLGAAEFIHPGEEIAPKVIRQLAKACSNCFQDISLDWGKLDITLKTPVNPGAIFQGSRITIYGRTKNIEDTKVTLSAKSSKEDYSWSIDIDTKNLIKDIAIPALMARSAIRDLEESNIEEAKSYRQKDRKKGSVSKEIIGLGCQYQIISSGTSFIAIEESTEVNSDLHPELRRVPIALTKGWSGHRTKLKLSDVLLSSISASICENVIGEFSTFRSVPIGEDLDTPTVLRRKQDDDNQLEFNVLENSVINYDTPIFDKKRNDKKTIKKINNKDKDLLIDIATLQQADGSWILNRNFEQITKISSSKLKEAVKKFNCNKEIAHRIVATLVAIHLFKTKLIERKDEWQLIVDKALMWIKNTCISIPEGLNWEE